MQSIKTKFTKQLKQRGTIRRIKDATVDAQLFQDKLQNLSPFHKQLLDMDQLHF